MSKVVAMRLFHLTTAAMETRSVCDCVRSVVVDVFPFFFFFSSKRICNKVSCSGWKSTAAETHRLFPDRHVLHVHRVSGFDLLWNFRLFRYGLFVLLILISFKCNLSNNRRCFWREKWELNPVFMAFAQAETNNND